MWKPEMVSDFLGLHRKNGLLQNQCSLQKSPVELPGYLDNYKMKASALEFSANLKSVYER